MPRRKPKAEELAAVVPAAMARLRSRVEQHERDLARRRAEAVRYVAAHEAELVARWTEAACARCSTVGEACPHFDAAALDYSTLDLRDVASRARETFAELLRVPVEAIATPDDLLRLAEGIAFASENHRT